LEADRSGKKIMSYADTIKPTLLHYRNVIAGGNVAVVGTEIPWAEAIMANLGARRITTLEYRPLTIEDNRVVTMTPSRFATKFLQANDSAEMASYVSSRPCASLRIIYFKYLPSYVLVRTPLFLQEASAIQIIYLLT